MTDSMRDLAQRGRALSPADRERLIDLLLDSLTEAPDPAVEEAWRLEIVRRIAANERGGTTMHDVFDVMDEAERLAP